MKRTDLVRLLEKNGWRLVREGGKHSVYAKNGQMETIPRHKEIAEQLAKAIIRRQGLK